MSERSAPDGTDKNLFQFLESKLGGSSLQMKEISKSKLVIEAEQLLAVNISVEEKNKKIIYTLYSPEWKRSITVEELDGFDFLESRAEEDLKKLNLETNAEDILLSIDLVRLWAEANEFTVEEETDLGHLTQ